MAVSCPECGLDLRAGFLESPEYRNCHVCGTEISVLPFPACFSAPARITTLDLARAENEASCFHHESKKAVQVCSRCGKFLCALCAAEFGHDVLCPECLVAGEQTRSDSRLEKGRILFDSLALTLAVAPAFTISFTVFGAPAAIYVALRYWKRPDSIVRRFRWRRWVALALGVAEVGFWIFIVITLVLQSQRPRT